MEMPCVAALTIFGIFLQELHTVDNIIETGAFGMIAMEQASNFLPHRELAGNVLLLFQPSSSFINWA